jgi:hypothetical protein
MIYLNCGFMTKIVDKANNKPTLYFCELIKYPVMTCDDCESGTVEVLK